MRFQSMLSTLALLSMLAQAATAAEPGPDFNREVLPLLSSTCFKCHGPDATERQAGLRLDVRDSAIGEADSGAMAIVPGRPEQSEMIRRLTSSDPDEKMPPPDSRLELTAKQVETLRKWVAAGAKYDRYWAYAPIRRPPASESGADWARNPIDPFVYRRLQQEPLRPSAEADPRTLLRRLNFDITGLPPSPQQLAEFLAASDAEDAYQQHVERLLESPHYGERMAMFWLDLVRYADSVGYHGDQEVSVSPFRDYVIEAFNANMPFDQFTREQLGGDLLPAATLRQKIASGYNRLGMMSAEGGVQPKEYLAKYAAERVRNVSLVWLGATMGCCECHDHKYDPYTAADFYSMASFFADIKEQGIYSGANRSGKWGTQVEYPDPQLPRLLQPIEQRIATLQTRLDTSTPELEAEQRVWEQSVSPTLQWQPLRPQSATALQGTKLTVQDDGAVLAGGPSANQNVYTLTATTKLSGITGLMIEALPDKSLPKNGPGRAGNGNFVLSEFRVAQLVDGAPVAVKLHNASASIEQTQAGEATPYGKWSAASAIDDDVQGASWGWAILPEAGKPSRMVVETVEPIKVGDSGEVQLQLTLEQQHTNPKHTLGRFRISVTAAKPPLSAAGVTVPEQIRNILLTAAETRSDAQQQQLADYFRSQALSLNDTREQLQQLQQQKQQLIAKHTRTSLVTVAVKPRTMRVLPRGNWMDDSGPEVSPAVPQFLPQLEAASRPSRLDLAEWIVAADNPLTARVFVNRLWKQFFGRGIVPSLDDFGKQGQQPSHPELLDWLADEFVRSGWDVKHMVKLIVSSATYRQSSQSDAEARRRDPYNSLLSRQGRFRLEAELIRDNALAVSGLLVRRIGGRSVRPYQPAGYYSHLNFPKRKYQHDSGDNLWRRGLYTHWQRQFLHPSLMAFDAPTREECAVDRPRSNTPLAALVLLNDPIYVEASRAFAQRVLREAPPDRAARLAFVFQQALLRDPRPAETAVLGDLLDQYQRDFQADPEQARALIEIGELPTPQDVNAVELACWTGVCRVVLNTHEFIIRN